MRRGTVTEFDEGAGLGTVVSDDGSEFLFHAVEIADGSRTIDVDVVVGFRPLPKFGSVEAADVTVL